MCCKDYSCTGLWPYREINILLLHGNLYAELTPRIAMMSFTRTSTVVSFIVSFYVLCILPFIVRKCVVKITLVRACGPIEK